MIALSFTGLESMLNLLKGFEKNLEPEIKGRVHTEEVVLRGRG